MTAKEVEREATAYPGFVVEFMPNSHRYSITLDGEKRQSVPSVTGILKILDKPALRDWYGRIAAAGAAYLADLGELKGVPPDEAYDRVRLHGLGPDDQRDAGAARGKAIHSALEYYVGEGTVPSVADFDGEHRPFIRGLCGWLLKAQPEPFMFEQVVGSPTHGFAGRFDLLATDGTLFDVKTSKGGRTYPEAHLQTAAYGLAGRECEINIERAVIVALDGEGGFVEVAGQASDLDFLSVLAAHRAMDRLRKLIATSEKAAQELVEASGELR